MGTRWRNKIIAFFMALLFAGAISGSLYFIFNNNWFSEESYFDTNEFQYELEDYANYLITSKLKRITADDVKEKIKVSKGEIEEHRYTYGSLENQLYNIRLQYEDRIQLAENGESGEDPEELQAERDEKLDDIRKNFSSDDHVEKKIREEKVKLVEEYFATQENFQRYSSRFSEDLQYYFEQNGESFTNTGVAKASINQAFSKDNMQYVTDYTISDRNYVQSYNWPYEDWLYQAITDVKGNYQGKIGVPLALASDSDLMVAKTTYEENRVWFWRFGIGSLIALFIWILIMFKVVSLPIEQGRWQNLYGKLPVDIRIIGIGLTGFSMILCMFLVLDSLDQWKYNSSVYVTELLVSIILVTVLSLLTFYQMRYLVASIKHASDFKQQWRNSLLVMVLSTCTKLFQRIFVLMQDAFLHTTTGIQVFVLLGIVLGLGFGAFMSFVDIRFFLLFVLYLIFIGVPALIVVMKSVGYFNKISVKTAEMALGKLGEPLEVKGNSILSKIAANINFLNEGVKVSINEQAKSERLKTELITNVSHDLRTPLTSIITYTELLKNNDLKEDDRAAYLEIIDRKSQRLKGLIDDLFEVSKMASGNMELVRERVDLNQLLQQALAEYDDSLKESNLHFRVANSDKSLYAMVDGQKMWRVFDNLIGNIVKYSLEHSRVYIQVQHHDNKAKITFKNVSKYELNDQSEELYERFKRGDTSRHTEGSGLGLAIAKSIIDLHEGNLDIETDGDLFKVTICLKVVE